MAIEWRANGDDCCCIHSAGLYKFHEYYTNIPLHYYEHSTLTLTSAGDQRQAKMVSRVLMARCEFRQSRHAPYHSGAAVVYVIQRIIITYATI